MNPLQWALFELRYLAGRAPWDTGITPPELYRFIDTHPAGKAIDIGCGTGTNCLTMAGRGWQATGIDFSWGAVQRARRRARRAGLAIEFHWGDVDRLARLAGPFDLALDIGCYHGLEPARRRHYAAAVAALVRPAGTFLLYGFLVPGSAAADHGIADKELERAFGERFELVDEAQGTDRGRPAAWFTLRRMPG